MAARARERDRTPSGGRDARRRHLVATWSCAWHRREHLTQRGGVQRQSCNTHVADLTAKCFFFTDPLRHTEIDPCLEITSQESVVLKGKQCLPFEREGLTGGAAVRDYLNMEQAAQRLHKSRRWLQLWLRNHPADQHGEPFYSPLGRTKTFDEDDVARIRQAAREEEKCRLSLYHLGPARRRTTRGAANTSESTLIKALRLATERSPAR